jgi:hypothetical protein
MTKAFIESAWGKVVTAVISSIATAAIMIAVSWPSSAVTALREKHDADIAVVQKHVDELSSTYNAQNVSIAEIRVDVKYIKEAIDKAVRP